MFCKKNKMNDFLGSKRSTRLKWSRGDGRDLDHTSVKLWITSMGMEQTHRWKTINGYTTALKKYERDHDTKDLPLHSRTMFAVLEGIRRKKGKEVQEPKPERKSLTLDMIVSIDKIALSQGKDRTYEDKLFLSAATMGVGGCLRSNNLVDCGGTQAKDEILRMDDIIFMSSEYKDSAMKWEEAIRHPQRVHNATIRLRRSKTDQRGDGTDVFIMGYPLMALLDYLSCFSQERQVEQILFVDSQNHNLTRTHLVSTLRSHLITIGLPSEEAVRFAGHCFRRGGCEHLDIYGNEVVTTAGRFRSKAHVVYHEDRHHKMKATELAGRPHGRGGLGGGRGIPLQDQYPNANVK